MTEGCPFSELPLDELLLGALQKLKFEKATPIQAGTVPVAVAGRDVIGQAQTGSGKTVAYALSVLQRIPLEGRGVEALVICPTRELAVQVTEAMLPLANAVGAHLLAAVGGHDISLQIAALAHRVDVLVGTPGRLLDLMYRGALDLGAVRTAVIDEADEMLKMGFIDDVEMILSCLPPEHQTLLFSATMPDRVRRLATGFLNDPAHVTVKNTEATVPDIEQYFYTIKGEERDRVLTELLEKMGSGQTIIFCATKSRVHHVMRVLSKRFTKIGAIEGDMPQAERDRMMRQFRRGGLRILVATDVLSRGIDVPDVASVVNYDCPRDVDSYVHRVGRTARAGASGTALTFVEPRDERLAHAIERRMGNVRRIKSLSALDDVVTA